MLHNSSLPLDALAPDQEVTALPPRAIENVMNQGLGSCFPAAQVLVYQGGDVLWHRAYGDVELTTLFDLASLTKLFTTTAFLALASEGRVMLTLPVADVIPEFATLGVDALGQRPVGPTSDPLSGRILPPEQAYEGQTVFPREMTFRHLLTHTGGLAPWAPVFEQVGEAPPPRGILDPKERARRRRQAIEILCASPFAGPPDSGIRYSDQGFILLGEAVARLHGALLETAIHERVIAPLGLTRTLFNPCLADIPLERIAPTEFDTRWRRRRLHGEPHDENAAALGGVAGHSGLFGTALDVARFGQAWLDAVQSDGAGALPVWPDLAYSATHLQEGRREIRRGFGWALKTIGDASSAGRHMSLETFGHTGFTGTSLFIDPTRDLCVVALTNRVYHGRNPEPIRTFRPMLHDVVVETLERA